MNNFFYWIGLGFVTLAVIKITQALLVPTMEIIK